jgi:hypothetical protein
MKVEVGDVVLMGGTDDWWADCLLVVEEVRSWGVIGVVRGPKHADYPLRVAFGEVKAVYRMIS